MAQKMIDARTGELRSHDRHVKLGDNKVLQMMKPEDIKIELQKLLDFINLRKFISCLLMLIIIFIEYILFMTETPEQQC